MQAKYYNSEGLIVPAISLPSIYNSVYLDKPRCKIKLLFSTEIGTWVFVSEVKSTSDISTQGVNDPSKGLIGGLTNEALYSFGVQLEKHIELVHSSYRGLYALGELIPPKPPDHNVILVPCSTVELNCLVVDVYWCYILVQSTNKELLLIYKHEQLLIGFVLRQRIDFIFNKIDEMNVLFVCSQKICCNKIRIFFS